MFSIIFIWKHVWLLDEQSMEDRKFRRIQKFDIFAMDPFYFGIFVPLSKINMYVYDVWDFNKIIALSNSRSLNEYLPATDVLRFCIIWFESVIHPTQRDGDVV